MSLATRSYDPAIRLLRVLSPLLSGGSSKLARGIRSRAGASARLRAWGDEGRDPSRPCVWFHAPSVGEGLQARAVWEALRERRPDAQAIHTWFSPSAEKFGRRLPVDVATCLPWDVQSELVDLLQSLRPNVIAFTKTEVWPGLAGAAEGLGIPVVLIAATLSEGAGRLRPVARSVLRPTFSRLDAVLAISGADGDRFLALGVEPNRIVVTGDPGIDSAWQRAGEADPEASYLRPFRRKGGAWLIAGSTWPSDERVLVAALRAALDTLGPGALRAVIAPHEPLEEKLRDLERLLGKADLRVQRLAEVERRPGPAAEEAEVVLVDRVGVLAHLYTVGNMAYVGGGFGRDGLHSVLEPAAARLPVLFGPRHGGSRAASELIGIGGGRSIRDEDELAKVLIGWVRDGTGREETGRRAAGYIEGHLGAARRTAERLMEVLPPESGTTHGSDRR